MKHIKQFIAPIVITLIVIIICAFFGIGYFSIAYHITNASRVCFIIAGIVAIAFIVTMITVLISRIREITKGEEDDLNNY